MPQVSLFLRYQDFTMLSRYTHAEEKTKIEAVSKMETMFKKQTEATECDKHVDAKPEQQSDEESQKSAKIIQFRRAA